MNNPLGAHPRSRDVLVVAALGGVALAVWWFRIWGTASTKYSSLANGDFFTQIYPMSHRAAEVLRSGSLPLWNPFQAGGMPFAATGIYGVFYPLNFPYLILPTAAAIEAVIVLHLALTGIATYLYGRALDLEPPAACLGGGLFMLSGYVTEQACWFPPALAACVWLPTLLLSLELLIVKRSLRGAFGIAVSIGMALLCGWPQLVLYTAYVAVAYTIVRVGPTAKTHGLRPAALLLAVVTGAVALGLCLAAVQLLPQLELQHLGPRREGALSARQSASFAILPLQVFLAELVDGTPGLLPFPYMGGAALVCAPVAFWTSRYRTLALFFLTVAAGGVVIALSPATPLADVVRLLPGLSLFRAAARALLLYSFGVSLLCAIGHQILLNGVSVHSARRVLPWLLVVVPGLILLVIGGTKGFVAPVFMLTLAALVAVTRLADGLSKKRAAWAIVAFICLDLARTLQNPFAHPAGALATLDKQNAVFEFIRARQGFDRTYFHTPMFARAYLGDSPELMAKQGTLRGIYSLTDYEPLSLSRTANFFRLLDPPKSIKEVLSTFTGALAVDPSAPSFDLLHLLGVRFVVASAADYGFTDRVIARGWRAVFRSPDKRLLVYEAPVAPLRAYVAGKVRLARSEEDALREVRQLGPDASTTVVLEAQSTPQSPYFEATVGTSNASIVGYHADYVEIEATTSMGGYLVLTDTWYPGWQATVDGVPASIERANVLFRSVAIPAGRHHVSFLYRPVSFTIGAIGTLAALGFLFLASVWKPARTRLRAVVPPP